MTKSARFYVPPEAWAEEMSLEGDEARHCAQVLRHEPGDMIALFNGCGQLASARIDEISKNRVRLTKISEETRPPPSPQLTLLQGVIKGDNMDWIIEKAVELGVARIIPVIAARSVVRVTSDDAAKKQEKWRRIALEACKQCRQVWQPRVEAPCSLAEAIHMTQNAGVKLYGSLESGAPSRPAVLNPMLDDGAPDLTTLAMAVGPEGDFSEAEYRQLASAGWQAWSLGGLTLRSETAAICALSILSYECRSDRIYF